MSMINPHHELERWAKGEGYTELEWCMVPGHRITEPIKVLFGIPPAGTVSGTGKMDVPPLHTDLNLIVVEVRKLEGPLREQYRRQFEEIMDATYFELYNADALIRLKALNDVKGY